MLILFTSDNFNPGLFNPILFNPTAQTFMIETSGVEKFCLALGLKMPWSRVEKFLLALGLKSPGLKVGVENSRVEMSCNHYI